MQQTRTHNLSFIQRYNILNTTINDQDKKITTNNMGCYRHSMGNCRIGF